MGNAQNKIECINFQQLKQMQPESFIINTMPIDCQKCLILHTIDANKETEVINDLLEKRLFKKTIIIYGKNHTDLSVHQKAKQLKALGFQDIKLYLGGLFEWLSLQDIYGDEEFSILGSQRDILDFL
jgi:hypothetical protein